MVPSMQQQHQQGRSKKKATKSKNNAKETNPTQNNLAEQLDRAATIIQQNAANMFALHAQWRNYLMFLAFLVFLLSAHQLQTVTSSCIQNIKAFNTASSDVPQQQPPPHDDAQRLISGSQATLLLLSDSAVHLLGVLLAAFLLLFFSSTRASGDTNVSNTIFRMAQACTVPMLMLHFLNGSLGGSNSDDDNALSCVRSDDFLRMGVALEYLPSLLPAPSRTAPAAVLVFHLVVLLSLWFMKYQHEALNQNATAVQQLQTELKKAQGASKKKI